MRNWFHKTVGVPMSRAVAAKALPAAACLALLSGCTATMSVNPLVPEKQSQQSSVLRKSGEDALPEPFGVPLGKKVADEQWMTGEDLEWIIVTNSHTAGGLRGRFPRYAAAVRIPDLVGRELLPSWSRSDLPPWRLARPFLGRTDVKLHVGADGAVCGFSVSDALRGGMTREESLAKIRSIREDVERECGFPLGEFVFRSAGQEGTDDEADTVADEALGSGLWLDLRAVVATSVTTRNGLRVSIKCNLYAPDANGDRGIPVKVSFVAVEARRRAEEAARAQDALVESRIAAMDAADVADLCGVAPCLPQGTDTNGLERVTLYRCDGTSDDKADVVFWRRKVEEGLPAPFFRSAEISYSYKTLRPYTIELDGGFPDDMSQDAVFRALDEFALSLNARYGIGLGRGMDGCSAGRNRIPSEYSFHNDNVSVHMNVRRHDGEAWQLSMTVTSMKYRKLMRREGEICGDCPQAICGDCPQTLDR